MNFGLLYGQGVQGLQEYARNSYGVMMSLEDAREYRERWFETYPAIRTWHRQEGIGFDAGEDSASTLTGRLRRVRSFMEKVNHPVQAAGADGVKTAMALLNERLPEYLGAKLVIACHDELVVECPEQQAEEVTCFLEGVMVDGMDKVINLGWTPTTPTGFPTRPAVQFASIRAKK
jgi:DNA polymerase-1